VNDILTELNLHMVPQQMELRELLPETDAEARILAQLDPAGEPRHIDEICRATGLPVAEVSGTLIMLELKGQTSLVGPMTYARAR
jgi:DNA processing protein